MRHLIDTTDISVAEVDKIINTALDIIDNREKYREVCKGKKLHDKRDSIAERDTKREMARALRSNNKYD